MIKKEKKKGTGSSAREKMLARKKELEKKGSGNGLLFPKEGTLRMRIKSPGDDQELGMEVVQFYIPGVGGVISPATFDEPCPFMEKYEELKQSKDEDDKELAKRLIPRRRYVIGGIIYKDDKGNGVDYDGQNRGVLIAGAVYQDIIDLYLDEDDWGDMTDPDDGYDIKITRTGKGKMDTNYSVTACPKGKNPNPKYIKEVDLEELIKAQMPSYDELEDKLNEFLNGAGTSSDDEEEEKPKKKSSKDKEKSKKKKKKGLDL